MRLTTSKPREHHVTALIANLRTRFEPKTCPMREHPAAG
jgi:hypothetical protein